MQEANESSKDEPTDQLVKLGPNLICNDHYFKYQTGTEVRCTKCPIGYQVGPGTEVKNGHIVIHGELVI